MALPVLLAFSLLLNLALGKGELVCEDLPVGMCSFAIATSGNRCFLETQASSSSSIDKAVGLQCKTSDVFAGNNLHEHIEGDECIKACGLHRKTIGISSDNLLDSQFTAKLCSPQCHENCDNIVDLYHNLALGEGVYLPNLCKTEGKSPAGASRTTQVELLSSGAAPPAEFIVSETAPAPSSDDPFFNSLSTALPPL